MNCGCFMEIDEKILDRIVGGDAAAYEHIYKLFYSKLLRFAKRFIDEEAHEIVQDSLLKLWENREQLRSIQSLEAYLMRSVRNACLNHIKHLQVESRYQATAAQALRELELQMYDDSGDPEIQERLQRALDQIPEQRKKIFYLSFIDGYKAKEISEMCGISERTVHTHVYNAMKFLRECLLGASLMMAATLVTTYIFYKIM